MAHYLIEMPEVIEELSVGWRKQERKDNQRRVEQAGGVQCTHADRGSECVNEWGVNQERGNSRALAVAPATLGKSF